MFGLQVPEITNYTMVNRTYRYFEGIPLFPFGYGLYVVFCTIINLAIIFSHKLAGHTLSSSILI